MSKNIFGVLGNTKEVSSDEEERDVKPMGRKEKKQYDKTLREGYGTTVQKDPFSKDNDHDDRKNKGDYGKGEKRPFDRHSGRGNQAYGNKNKKGGHGKGNVGKDGDYEEHHENEDRVRAPVVEEPREEVMGVEEYLKQNGRKFGLETKNEEIECNVKQTDDDNLILVKSKKKDNRNRNKKQQESLFTDTLNNQIVGVDRPAYKKFENKDRKPFNKNGNRGDNKNYNNRGGNRVNTKNKEEFPGLN